MDLFDVQLTVLLCLLLGNVLFGIIPLTLSKAVEYFSNSEDGWSRKTKCATFLLYIGAGIFISNSFVVLLPQANHEITHETNHSHDHAVNGTSPIQQDGHSKKDSGHHHDSFPKTEFIVLCGFFLAYVLQEAMYFLLSKCSRQPKESSNMRVSFCSCAKRHTECSRTFKAHNPDQTLFGLEKKLMESGNIASSSGNPANMLSTTNMPPEIEVNAQSELLRSSILAQAVPNYGAVTNVTEPTLDNPLPPLTPPVHLADENRLVKTQHSEKRQQFKFLTSSFLIVLSLFLQYIFQGIYLGLQSKDTNQWLWLVVCLQHYILTFSLGSYLAVGNTEFPCVALVTGLLSIVPPIGMIVAMVDKSAVMEISHQAIGVVFAVACGILIYATFYEMLRHRSDGSVVGLVKLLAITIGAGITILLQYANIVILNKR